MADLKELGIDVSFKREFFYECMEQECRRFLKSWREFRKKKISKNYDEREMWHYMAQMKRTAEMFEKNGSEEDQEIKDYLKFRKEHFGY